MLLEKLNQKIDELLQIIQEQKNELQSLRLKVTTLTTQNEEKDRQISQLYEQIAQKDSEIQKIYEKIQENLQNG
ncbi:MULTISPECIES: DUF904 domain-containing protein [unclassified Helicobacter]|uniref:DUF904 domain-containing protein n=1 Tax=unclassified Helicobacter TaxID=2593540 RepID=UPI000CF0FDD0|nr:MULTISPECIES: DUF904 domain-containing protein [unclassified Helicobacter]